MVGRVAGYVYSSTDNLVISTFSGIISAGGFSNYKYVTNAVKNMIHSMTDSITATIGNFVQDRNAEESFRMLKRYTFIRYIVANIVALGLCICTDDLIALVFGKQYLMAYSITVLIVIDMYVGIIYGPINDFINVLGYFSYEKYLNVIGAAINLGVSILFVQFIGIQGVLLGTCISQLFFLISKSILVCKKYFADQVKLCQLWKWYISFICLGGAQIYITGIVMEACWGNQYSWPLLFLKAAICVVIPVATNAICFYKTDEYRYLLEIVRIILGKVTRRKVR